MAAAGASDAVELVVGLGNPGPGHADDRHNAGFWFVDALAARWRVELRDEPRFKGRLGRAASGVRLLEPLTFMNLSGESVVACAHYFRIPPEAVLVVHDELDLPPGAVRLKRGGGHGGHNGLRSIESQLGSNAYLRLRIGIGHPGAAREVSNYVLGRPGADDRAAIGAALDSALEQVDAIVGGGFDRVMNTLNRKREQGARQ